MKKILSIIMSICMLLTLVAVPVNVFATEVDEAEAYKESTLGSYYKFTFGEDEMYNYVKDATVEYKGSEFTPLYYQSATGASAGYKQVTDSVTGDKYDTLQLQTGSGIMFTPVTKDGQPFEMKPGVDYTVKVNMFQPVGHCWVHAFTCVGYQNPSEQQWGKYINIGSEETPEYLSTNYPYSCHLSYTNQGGNAWAYAVKDGTYGKTSTLSTIEGSTGVCLHKEDERFGVTCTHASQTTVMPYVSKTRIENIPADHFVYDNVNKRYTATRDVYNDNEGTDSGKDATYTNYLTLYLGGGSASQYAKNNYPIYGNYTYDDMYDEEGKNIPIYDTYQIESIEIYETPEPVVFDYLTATDKTVEYAYGATINYPALTANLGNDHVWSLSKDEYVPVPERLETTKGLTVYEIKSNVLSFENYKKNVISIDNAEQERNTTVTSEMAYSGSHSILLTNANVYLQASEPADWATAYTNYFYYDQETKKYVNFAAADTAPAFESGKVFVNRASTHLTMGTTILRDIGKVTEKIGTTANYGFPSNDNVKAYKVTFKYFATENNTTASKLQLRAVSYANIYNGNNPGGTTYSTDEFEFPAGPSNGWKTATITFADAGNIKANAQVTFALDMRFVGDSATRQTNEIYIDDVVVEEASCVAFVAYNGAKTAAVHENGEAIKYPTTPASYNAHYVWSLDPDTYVPAPITFSGNVTVYQIASDVNSFQNDIPVDAYMFKPVVPSVQYTDEGNGDHRAMRIRNYGVNQRLEKPANWTDSNYSKELYYDEATDSYKNITAAMYNSVNGDYEKFVAEYGPAFEKRNGTNLEQVNLPLYQFNAASTTITQNFKVTFKYKFTDFNEGRPVKVSSILGNHTNIWGGGYQAISDQYVILPYSDSDEWQTATLYTVINGLSVNDKYAVFALKFEEVTDPKNYMSTFTVLVDDVKVEEFVNTPTVIFHDGETVTEVTEGVAAGEAYTPTLVGTNAPEGLTFKGWSTTSDGLNIVDTITMPSASVACVVELYAVYAGDPTIVYHDNGNDTTITDGLEYGGTYKIDRVGAGVEGKYFAGWATTENGTDSVVEVTLPGISASDFSVDLYAVYRDYIDADNFEVDYRNYTAPAIKGIAYKGYSKQEKVSGTTTWVPYDEYSNVLVEGGYCVSSYTADGLKLTKSETSNQAYAFNPAKTDGLSAYNGGGYVTAKNINDEIGTVKTVGWGVTSTFVLRDSDGYAIMAKPGTTYSAVITYKVTKAGAASVGFVAGRKNQYMQYGSNDYNLGSYAYAFGTQSIATATSEATGEYQTVAVTITTPASFGTGVAPLAIYTSLSGYTARRVEKATIGGEEFASYTLNDGTVVYPYEVINVPEFYISNVELYEVDKGNVFVTYARYDVENEEYTYEHREEKQGADITVPTNNYDPKWYSESDKINANNIVSVYPSKTNTTLYNATYVQNNPVAGMGGTNVVGDGKKNGGTEQEWTFENSLYDGKYALHIGGAKKQIIANDVENYVTGTVLQQGHTYKVTFKYQATKAHGKFGFTFTSCQGDNYWSNDGAKGSITINAGEATDGWVTANAYFTADLSGTVQDETETGLDYNVQRTTWMNKLFMTYTQDANEAGNDLYFADIEVIDLGDAVVEEDGASILTDEAAEEADQQAMRFYFNYKTDDGSNIYLGDDVLTVVERGFYYRNGYVASGGAVATMYTADVKKNKTDNFNTCWAYDEASKMMTFSSYITGFKLENDDRKLEVKAYIIVETDDGSRYTIYSDSINRTVAGVGAGTDLDINDGQ